MIQSSGATLHTPALTQARPLPLQMILGKGGNLFDSEFLHHYNSVCTILAPRVPERVGWNSPTPRTASAVGGA